MSGEIPRQPPAIARRAVRDSLPLAAGFLGLLLCVDICLANGLIGQRWHLGKDLQSLACLVAQTFFLSLLVRRAIKSADIACLVFVGNFLLVSAVVGIYSAQHPSHYGYASACLAGQLAFLAIWLILGEQPLGWRVLGTCAGGGLLIVGWYGYAARRSGVDWNLIWMSETLAVTAIAALLRVAGFQIRFVGELENNPQRERGQNQAEGEGQYKLWHLMAGLFIASCLLGLARLLGIIKPTYFANLAATELDAADLQRGLGVGFAAALAVGFAAHSVLLRANFATRYLPPLVYAIAMGYAVHTWGPPYVDAAIVRSAWNVNIPGSSPTTSQWPFWMLLNTGIAMGGTMFLHALGYRLTRNWHWIPK
jgi:hypothetical protein